MRDHIHLMNILGATFKEKLKYKIHIMQTQNKKYLT